VYSQDRYNRTNRRSYLVGLVAAVIIGLLLALFPDAASARNTPPGPKHTPSSAAQAYSYGCVDTVAEDEVWTAVWAHWWDVNSSNAVRNANIKHWRSQLSAACAERFDTLTVALDVCFEAYDEASGNHWRDVWEQGEYLGDSLTEMSRGCRWYNESAAYSIAHWYEGWSGVRW
jgi:hypothetical protein